MLSAKIKMTLAIGIDLGTTKTCVGVFQNGRVEVIPNEQGNRSTANYVAFNNHQRFIGDTAKNQGGMNAENTIFNAKRLIGCRIDDSVTQREMRYWPFEVVESEREGKAKVKVQCKSEVKTFFPEEITAMVLTKMKTMAEEYLGEEVV